MGLLQLWQPTLVVLLAFIVHVARPDLLAAPVVGFAEGSTSHRVDDALVLPMRMTCSFNGSVRSINAISFAIPAELVVPAVPNKTRLFPEHLQKPSGFFNCEDQDKYYADLQRSRFMATQKKSGWDCLRHYEILMNGCVPLFKDLEECPQHTMAMLNKPLLDSISRKAGRGGDAVEYYSSPHADAEYQSIANDLLDYTRQFLTTKHLARYVLNAMGHPHASKVLYIYDFDGFDYQASILFHGFRDLLGDSAVDFPRIDFMYKGEGAQDRSMWGCGWTVTNILGADDGIDRENVVENIEVRWYDVVVYGTANWKLKAEELLMWDAVAESYPPSRIAFIDGFDDLYDECRYDMTAVKEAMWSMASKGHMFRRELYDECAAVVPAAADLTLAPATSTSSSVSVEFPLPVCSAVVVQHHLADTFDHYRPAVSDTASHIPGRRCGDPPRNYTATITSLPAHSSFWVRIICAPEPNSKACTRVSSTVTVKTQPLEGLGARL